MFLHLHLLCGLVFFLKHLHEVATKTLEECFCTSELYFSMLIQKKSKNSTKTYFSGCKNIKTQQNIILQKQLYIHVYSILATEQCN